ncbi:MAG: S8 family serine peptidase, partial [Nitrososphaera sp.]
MSRKLRTLSQLTISLLLLSITVQVFAFQSVSAQSAESAPTYISTEFTSEMLSLPTPVPTIVEFDKLPSGVYAARATASGVTITDQDLQVYTDSIKSEHQQFLSKLTSMGIAYLVTEDNVVINEREQSYLPHEFTYVYNGLGLQVPGNAINTIAGLSEVAAIFPNWPKQYALLDTSVDWIQAKRVWSQLGAKGEGMRIAVIDTGIDWTHPAFGGFLVVPNSKVIFAMTFTAGTVMDDFGHGTHVSGIAAGDLYRGTPRGDSLIEGVAPKALLMSYKVLTASGSGLSASVVRGIEDASQNNPAHQKAHVINLSLGSTSGDPESADSRAVNNAAEVDVVPAVSAGNSGPGESTIGSPGAAKNAITVGANNDNNVGYFFLKVTSPPGQRQDIQAQMFSNSLRFPNNPPLNTNYVFCGLMATAADCLPTNVQGKIALIERGTATFTLKGRNAELAGASAAIIYNNVPGPFTGFMEPGIGIPVAAISREEGLYLRGLGFDPTGFSLATLLLDPNGIFAIDQIAGFSSRGPNDDLRIKPNVLAPGVDTFSATVLASAPVVAMGNPEGYTEASGTSMAAPHVAGAAALLRQVHSDWNAFDVRAALMNTAIRIYDLEGKILRVMDQGAGRIDVFEAATTQA